MASGIRIRRGWRDWWHVAAAGAALAAMIAWLLFGTTGLFAWNDYNRLLKQRRAELVLLEQRQHVLANHQRLLNPGSADPDLSEELMRERLNLVHPDDIIVPLR